MRSNRHNLPVWTQFSVFHDCAEHSVVIDINGQEIFSKTFAPGIKHPVKIDDFFDFYHSGRKKITIDWNSEKETPNKYFKFNRWVINNQHISSFKCMYVPYENEYIKDIRTHGTEEEKKQLRKQIIFACNSYGWFGKMSWDFVLGDVLEQKQTLQDTAPERILNMHVVKIFMEQEDVEFHVKAKKKY